MSLWPAAIEIEKKYQKQYDRECKKAKDRLEHRRWVLETCGNQGIDIRDVNVDMSCPPGSLTIFGKARRREAVRKS